VKRIAYLVLPPLLYCLFIYIVLKVFGYYLVGFLIAYFVPPAGKESIIPLLTSFLKSQGFGSFEAIAIPVVLITATDMITAFFVIWNFDILNYIPKLGEILLKLEKKARKFIDEYDLAKNTYFGLFIFVFIPFQGTGATTASVIGKLLGLENVKLFVTITSASLSSSLFIAIISNYLSSYFKNSVYSVLVVVAFVLLLGVIAKTIKRYYSCIKHFCETQGFIRKNAEGKGHSNDNNRHKEDFGK